MLNCGLLVIVGKKWEQGFSHCNLRQQSRALCAHTMNQNVSGHCVVVGVRNVTTFFDWPCRQFVVVENSMPATRMT